MLIEQELQILLSPRQKYLFQKNAWQLSFFFFNILVIRQNGSLPVKYGLTMDMEAKYSDIKPFLSRLTKIPVENLILVDIVQAQFR